MIKDSSKLLSIIVPSYNMEAFLPKCLGSVIVDDAKLLKKLEVIVVNDGSKDRTSEIAHDFERRYPGVFRVIDKANGHYGSCINAALAAAEGKYVKVLDADDWFDTKGFGDFLQKLDLLQEQPDLVLTDYEIVDGAGNVTHSVSYSLEHYIGFPLDRFLTRCTNRQMHAYTYRLALLKEMGYVQCEGVAYSDVEWTVVPLVSVRSVYYIPVSVYRYLVGREGQTVSAAMFRRNSWMADSMVMHLCQQFYHVKDRCQDNNFDLLQPVIVSLLASVYRRRLLTRNDLAGSSLKEYDAQIWSVDHDLYLRLNGVLLASRFPIKYIQVWRRQPSLLCLIRVVAFCYDCLSECRRHLQSLW